MVFTTIRDDSVGGDTNRDSTTTSPAAGDWSGISVNGGSLVATGTTVRYAGTALSASGGASVVAVVWSSDMMAILAGPEPSSTHPGFPRSSDVLIVPAETVLERNRSAIPLATMALLELRDLHLAFGGPDLLDGVDLRLEAGERVCLIGRNGVGKTTLLKTIAGLKAARDEFQRAVERLRQRVL